MFKEIYADVWGKIVGRSWGACICYGNFCGLESQVQVASQVSGTDFLGMSRSMEFGCISRTGRCRGWWVGEVEPHFSFSLPTSACTYPLPAFSRLVAP